MLQTCALCVIFLSLSNSLVIEEQILAANKQELEVVQTRRETKTKFTGQFNEHYSVQGSNEDILESNEQLSKELSFETAWTKTGRRKLTKIKVIPTNITLESDFDSINVQEDDDIPTMLTRRNRRELFGKYRRFYIPTRSFAQRFPFEVVVKISTGCTGTVVSTRHVLTSAHCLHTGKDYTKGFRSLRVGFLLPNRTIDWINAHQVKLPLAWVQGNDTDASRYDYAIIKLAKRHRRRSMPLTYSHGNRFGRTTKIHFTAFEDDKPANTIWYRSCFIEGANNDMMYHCCDAQPGSSGAGVYVYYNNKRTGQQDRLVVGVFSGHRVVRYHPLWPRFGCPPVWRGNFNAAIRINPLKFKQICHWIGIRHAQKDCKRYLLSLPSREPPRKTSSKQKKDKNRKRRGQEARKRDRARTKAKKLQRREKRLKRKRRKLKKQRRKGKSD